MNMETVEQVRNDFYELLRREVDNLWVRLRAVEHAIEQRDIQGLRERVERLEVKLSIPQHS
jgi:hypothetical protein